MVIHTGVFGRQIFSQKWTKWGYFFKENNWQYLSPIIEFELSSLLASQYLKT